jgi:hypothetical protein
MSEKEITLTHFDLERIAEALKWHKNETDNESAAREMSDTEQRIYELMDMISLEGGIRCIPELYESKKSP